MPAKKKSSNKRPKKIQGKLKETEFYCVSCRKRMTSIPDELGVQTFRLKGRNARALRGVCKKCDVNLCKFVKEAKFDKLKDKYGTWR